jgi:hypothetical protein
MFEVGFVGRIFLDEVDDGLLWPGSLRGVVEGEEEGEIEGVGGFEGGV